MTTGTPPDSPSDLWVLDLASTGGATIGATPIVLDPGDVAAADLAAAAVADSFVVVRSIERAVELADAGAPRARLIVLLDLASTVAADAASLASAGWSFGVRVDGSGTDDATRGAIVGLLTVAIQAGAVLVDTTDPRTAKRVVAVVEAVRSAGAKARG